MEYENLPAVFMKISIVIVEVFLSTPKNMFIIML